MPEKGDAAPVKRKCGAPCIINVSNGFHLVFCDKETGHPGQEHRFLSADVHKKFKIAVLWMYMGMGNQFSGISSASPLDGKRCEIWARFPQVDRLDIGSGEYSRKKLLQFVEAGMTSTDWTAFCCGKDVGHTDRHARAGNFAPLGINWLVGWPFTDEELEKLNLL